MATPKNITDGSSDLDEAVLNNYVNGLKSQVKVNFAGITFVNSSTSAGLSSTDTAGEITGSDVSWDGTNNKVDVTLSGFSAEPAAQVSFKHNGSSNVGQLLVNTPSSSAAEIYFLSGAAGQGTGDSIEPDGDVRFFLFLIGS